MISLEGWSNPGRVIGETLHNQMFGIMNFLKNTDRIGGHVYDVEMQVRIGETIDVNQASTVRHIIGFMKSVGILFEDALESGKIPTPTHCISPSGELLYNPINMEKLAIESENKGVLNTISDMYKEFYANAFIYWFVRDSKIHVARTILKAVKKYGYLDKIEWFIINTYISKTDNEKQEQLADQYITAYRSKEITLTSDNIKKSVNSYNYWTQLLNYSGLVKKIGNKIYIGNQFPELTEAILAEDFLKNLNVKDRYYLEM